MPPTFAAPGPTQIDMRHRQNIGNTVIRRAILQHSFQFVHYCSHGLRIVISDSAGCCGYGICARAIRQQFGFWHACRCHAAFCISRTNPRAQLVPAILTGKMQTLFVQDGPRVFFCADVVNGQIELRGRVQRFDIYDAIYPVVSATRRVAGSSDQSCQVVQHGHNTSSHKDRHMRRNYKT